MTGVEVPAAEELYRTLKPLLLRVAIGKFGIPADQAEELVQDVFVSYVRRRPDLTDTRRWFIGAIAHACRHYWRKNGRYVSLTDADLENSHVAPRIEDAIVRNCLARLQSRDARIVWLRFAEGHTVGELAAKLGVSKSRTEKLLRRALQRLAEKLAAPDPADDANRWLIRIFLRTIDTYVTCGGCRAHVPSRGSRGRPRGATTYRRMVYPSRDSDGNQEISR